MNHSELHIEFPQIAQVFEAIIQADPDKYYQQTYNYLTEGRGISLTKIMRILKENKKTVKVVDYKWWEVC